MKAIGDMIGAKEPQEPSGGNLEPDLVAMAARQKKRRDEALRADKEDMRKLMDKHVPFGYYQREVKDIDGNPQLVPTDVRHPFKDLANGSYSLGSEKEWMYGR